MALRADGKRVRKADPMYTVVPYIMAQRNDAMNMITVDVPVKPIQDYINNKRKEGVRLSHMSVVMAAYLRTVHDFPLLNNFIVNKKIYKHNEFKVAMVVLKSLVTQEETMSKVQFELDDTVFDVNQKMTDYVESNRKESTVNNTDKMISFLVSIPGLLRVGVGLFKLLDRYGLLPKFITDLSPFHASVTLTNLASIRTNHIYHHIYNFGTTSVFIAMGKNREVAKKVNGEIVFEKCMPLGVVMDERICSGIYFAAAFRKFSAYLENPTLLEEKPENKDN
ncbi:MAG: 2-oxo acid dehydrogenase subunit E2 [Clostridia bacterium]|nr:2-oxo acid dehydrogenase subunit E2 [Clostridia bacterium]